jgi:hypothetical protein
MTTHAHIGGNSMLQISFDGEVARWCHAHTGDNSMLQISFDGEVA